MIRISFQFSGFIQDFFQSSLSDTPGKIAAAMSCRFVCISGSFNFVSYSFGLSTFPPTQSAIHCGIGA